MAARRALIVWGGWNGHTPDQSAGVVADMLRAEGFEVAVEDTTRAFADPGLEDLDLIVPVITMALTVCIVPPKVDSTVAMAPFLNLRKAMP